MAFPTRPSVVEGRRGVQDAWRQCPGQGTTQKWLSHPQGFLGLVSIRRTPKLRTVVGGAAEAVPAACIFWVHPGAQSLSPCELGVSGQWEVREGYLSTRSAHPHQDWHCDFMPICSHRSPLEPGSWPVLLLTHPMQGPDADLSSHQRHSGVRGPQLHALPQQ